VTIEDLLTQQNALLLRIAEGVDRLVLLAEKDAGVSTEASTMPPVWSAPAIGGSKFHALVKGGNYDDHKDGSWRWQPGVRSAPREWCGVATTEIDETQIRLASDVSEDQWCRHSACYQQLSGIPHRRKP
jgi:hypothetical protein